MANDNPNQCCGNCKWCDEFHNRPPYPGVYSICENEQSHNYGSPMTADESCPCYAPKELPNADES